MTITVLHVASPFSVSMPVAKDTVLNAADSALHGEGDGKNVPPSSPDTDAEPSETKASLILSEPAESLAHQADPFASLGNVPVSIATTEDVLAAYSRSE